MEPEIAVSTKAGGSFMSPCCFWPILVTPRNTQSNLERRQQSNSERKTQIKVVPNKSKLSKSDGTNQNYQADLLIESGVEVLNALKHKANQSDQRRSQDFKFGDLIGSELVQIPTGHFYTP